MDNAVLVYNYYALTLAILRHDYSIDRAISRFSPEVKGKFVNSITPNDIADMIKLRETMTYQAIGGIYNMSPDAVCHRISRFKKKNVVGGGLMDFH